MISSNIKENKRFPKPLQRFGVFYAQKLKMTNLIYFINKYLA
jgi:hypothetical protein